MSTKTQLERLLGRGLSPYHIAAFMKGKGYRVLGPFSDGTYSVVLRSKYLRVSNTEVKEVQRA